MGEEEEKQGSLLSLVLLVFTFITDTVLTLHTGLPPVD